MKIISWNCNSIKARKEHILMLLEKEDPDVLMVQETRVSIDSFPELPLRYKMAHSEAVKGRNGVAIITKHEMEMLAKDEEGRFVHVLINGIQFICVYVPNGGSISSSVEHKMKFYKYLSNFYNVDSLIIAGDFNVVYKTNECNVENPYTLPEQQELIKLERHFNYQTKKSLFLTWWDYRDNRFNRNIGMGLDKIYNSQDLKCSTIEVLDYYRRLPSPSDHAPIMCEIIQ